MTRPMSEIIDEIREYQAGRDWYWTLYDETDDLEEKKQIVEKVDELQFIIDGLIKQISR